MFRSTDSASSLQNLHGGRRFGSRVVGTAMLLGIVLGGSGCNNAFQGGASGAAFGALAGLGLGSLTGDMGKGAAAGAIIGGLGGAILGDQNSRRGD